MTEVSFQPNPEVLDAYREALKGQIWDWEKHPDPYLSLAGKCSMQVLLAARKDIDRSGEIWNSIAPEGHKVEPL